jgi:hypothetical protein
VVLVEVELLSGIVGGADATDDARTDQQGGTDDRGDPGRPHPAGLEVENLLS